ncbi:MAG: hypothetical protein AAF915_16760 [Cyanobacteria bacterium P01_D01_bin.50]
MLDYQKADFEPITAYFSSLPPVEERNKIPNTEFLLILLYWYWLGRAIEAFFNNKPNPLCTANLSPELIKLIDNSVSRYLALSILFFKTERLLRNEAENQGIPYLRGLTRSDFLKIWAREECFWQVGILQQNHWESHGKRQNEERKREIIKYFGEEVSEEKLEILKQRWIKEDSKLYQDENPTITMPFTEFCLSIFRQNKRIPEVKDFIKTWYRGVDFKKFTIVNGNIRVNKTRGKDKQKRKIS